MLKQRGARWIKGAARVGVRTAAMSTARFRVLPDVVIIGVKRGGTTSLFRDLERHPSMCPLVPSAQRLPLRENMKGVHYFDTNMTRSPRWYRSHFATDLTRRRRARSTGAAFTAEASPYYFFHPLGARRAVLGLPADTIFVVMLRDPVERTVSHWAEQTRNGVETLSLPEALEAEATRLDGAEAALIAGSTAVSHAHEQQSYASQSFYAESLRRWFDAAGRDRVLVVFSEDYYRDAAATIDRITDALHVPRMRDVGEHRNAAPRPGALSGEVEGLLTERFRDDVDRLAALLDVVPPWPRFFSSPSAATMTPR
jgi:hypothetical protein